MSGWSDRVASLTALPRRSWGSPGRTAKSPDRVIGWPVACQTLFILFLFYFLLIKRYLKKWVWKYRSKVHLGIYSNLIWLDCFLSKAVYPCESLDGKWLDSEGICDCVANGRSSGHKSLKIMETIWSAFLHLGTHMIPFIPWSFFLQQLHCKLKTSAVHFWWSNGSPSVKVTSWFFDLLLPCT